MENKIKHTKENVLKVLQALLENKWSLYEYFDKHGNEDMATQYFWEYTGLKESIMIIQNKCDFEFNYDLFKKEIEK